MTQSHLYAIHDLASNNRKLVEASARCGCFYCCKTFASSKVTEYHYDPVYETALCPFCGIDSVLPGCVINVRKRLLKAMYKRWFSCTGNLATEFKEKLAKRHKALGKLTAEEKQLIIPRCDDGPATEWE